MLTNNCSLKLYKLNYNKNINISNKENIIQQHFLTDKEYKLLQEILLINHNSQITNLWQNLLINADQILCRNFLDNINIVDNSNVLKKLLEINYLKIITKIFANNNYAKLWLNLSIKPDNLTEFLFQFEKFMLNVEGIKGIGDSLFLSLLVLSTVELKSFILFFNKAKNPYLQLKYFQPNFIVVEDKIKKNINDLDGLVDWDKFKFMNYQMLIKIEELPNQVLLSIDNLINYISYTNMDVDTLKVLCLIYMAILPDDPSKKLDFCLDILMKKYTYNQISDKFLTKILKMSCIAINSLTINELNHFLLSSFKVYERIGNYVFSLIISKDFNLDGLKLLQNILQNIQYLFVVDVEIVMDANNLKDLMNSLMQQKILYLKNPANTRSLEEVLTDFLGQNPNVKFPLTQNEVNILRRQFKLIKKFEEEVNQLNQTQIISKIIEIKSNLIKKTNDVDNICQLIAIANIAFIQYFNIYLHNVQILTVLGLLLPNTNLKGRLAQVKTGEGKSSIVTLLALIFACQNKFVDIISSTTYLSIRDEQKYKKFFEYFGITTSHICNNYNNFNGQIVYGTNYNFEFAKLFDDLYMQKNRLSNKELGIKRPFQVVIVDEVDNMLIDKSLNSARISYPSKTNLISIYRIIYDFIVNHTTKLTSLNTELFNECSKRLDKHNISELNLQQLIENAYKAFHDCKLNLHYCIKKTVVDNVLQDNIVIIDLDTGRLNEGSRWQNGLHQFLELKHNLPIKPDSLTVGSLSHPAFFKEYSEIYGLSGTIGEKAERKEIFNIYNLTTFDVPTYKVTLRKQLDTIICDSQEKFNDTLINETNQVLSQSRPVLILCQSIVATEEIARLLRNKIEARVLQTLNDLQMSEEDFIVRQAGSSGVVTIATNAAGRGTDIPITKLAMQNGGLHVIFTFFPSNQRIEDQGAGRAGRQGNYGSYRIIVPHNDYYCLKIEQEKKKNLVLSHVMNILFNSNNIDTSHSYEISEINVESILKYRAFKVEQESKNRVYNAKINLIKHDILERFYKWYHLQFSTLDFNKDEVLSKWAEFYTNLENMEMDESDSELLINNEEKLDQYKLNLESKFQDFYKSLLTVENTINNKIE